MKFKIKMIKIIKNTRDQVTLEKETREEFWLNNDCSDKNILKFLNREYDTIERIQFDDGKFIASLLHIYFK